VCVVGARENISVNIRVARGHSTTPPLPPNSGIGDWGCEKKKRMSTCGGGGGGGGGTANPRSRSSRGISLDRSEDDGDHDDDEKNAGGDGDGGGGEDDEYEFAGSESEPDAAEGKEAKFWKRGGGGVGEDDGSGLVPDDDEASRPSRKRKSRASATARKPKGGGQRSSPEGGDGGVPSVTAVRNPSGQRKPSTSGPEKKRCRTSTPKTKMAPAIGRRKRVAAKKKAPSRKRGDGGSDAKTRRKTPSRGQPSSHTGGQRSSHTGGQRSSPTGGQRSSPTGGGGAKRKPTTTRRKTTTTTSKTKKPAGWRRNRRSRREPAAPLTADDFRRETDEKRRQWGCYTQMNPTRDLAPYTGKTDHLVRRTGQHRRLKCKHTRRFRGAISPVFFVNNGFGGDRDAQQYEARMQHEYSHGTRRRNWYGGTEARVKRDRVTESIRVPVKRGSPHAPSAALRKTLSALCSMLQVAQWSNQAIPIGHAWRTHLPEFVMHWFGPDPVCYGFDVKRLVAAFPVRHVFDCKLEDFARPAAPRKKKTPKNVDGGDGSGDGSTGGGGGGGGHVAADKDANAKLGDSVHDGDNGGSDTDTEESSDDLTESEDVDDEDDKGGGGGDAE
jgi:hypothetical protein